MNGYIIGAVIGFIFMLGFFLGVYVQEDDVDTIDELEPRCYEDVNDRVCRDVDSNTRECWNAPRRVSIDCDAKGGKDE